MLETVLNNTLRSQYYFAVFYDNLQNILCKLYMVVRLNTTWYWIISVLITVCSVILRRHTSDTTSPLCENIELLFRRAMAPNPQLQKPASSRIITEHPHAVNQNLLALRQRMQRDAFPLREKFGGVLWFEPNLLALRDWVELDVAPLRHLENLGRRGDGWSFGDGIGLKFCGTLY